MRELSPDEISLRKKRSETKKIVRELNNIGKRLVWCREKLGLTQRDVVQATEIPGSSYNGREAGVMAIHPEEYLLLSLYFTKKWKVKYIYGTFPKHEGTELKNITINWLLFGYDEAEENSQAIIDEYKIEIAYRERECIDNELNAKRQLEMFMPDDLLKGKT